MPYIARDTSVIYAAADTAAAGLDNDQLQALVIEARRRWASVEDASLLAALDRLEFVVADLPGERLAEFSDGRITIDVDAAGQGWFVDLTPGDDLEFSGTGATLFATPTGGAAGRIDLLSVLAHEMGHAIGFGHSESGVMDDERMPGERALPDAWFASDSEIADTRDVAPNRIDLLSAVEQELDLLRDATPASAGGPEFATANGRGGASFTGIRDFLGLTFGMSADVSDRSQGSGSLATNPPASTAFTGPPQNSIIIGSGGAQQAGPQRYSDFGSSFVNLASPLGLSTNLIGGVQAQPVGLAEIDPALAADQGRSSSAPVAPPNGPPVIDWNGVPDQVNTATKETSVWLDDFLNHRGQTALQRNPNAAMRVRPASARI